MSCGQWSEGDGNFEFRVFPAKSHVAYLKLLSVSHLEFSMDILAVKILPTVGFFKSADRPSVFWKDSMIVLHLVHNYKESFSNFIASGLTIKHEGTNVKQCKCVQLADSTAYQRVRGTNNLQPPEKQTNGTDFLSLLQKTLTSERPRQATSADAGSKG